MVCVMVLYGMVCEIQCVFTGDVKEGELEMATLADSDSTSASSSTNFTCGSHFYEEVEDTKDSVWVVQVCPIVI